MSAERDCFEGSSRLDDGQASAVAAVGFASQEVETIHSHVPYPVV